MSLRWILSFAWPWRWTLALCSLLMLAETAVSLAVPWLAGRYAGGLFTGSVVAVGGLLVWLVMLLAAQGLLRFFSGWATGRTAEAVLASLRVRLYDHLQALPLGWFQQRKHGDVVALLTYDVERLSTYLSGTLTNLLPLLVSLVGALVMMARIDGRLTLLVLATVPVFYLVMKVMGRRLRPLSNQLQQAYADAMAVAEENLQMLPAIKTFTREPLESARYREHVDRIFRLSNQERLIYAAMGPTVQFLAAAGMVLVLWLLGSGQGRSPAEMVSFLLYAAFLTRPVGSLADIYGQTRQARGALQRLGEVLQELPEPDASTAADLPPVRGEIGMQDVGFAYPGRGPTLQGLNLRVMAGETVALTGVNGAGKSTLVHLLMRLIVPSQGVVRIDGHDIAGVRLESLRRQIGVVPQHVLLFNGSVLDNIAWGLPGASLDAVQEAARKAQAHDFITQLPQGYDTLIGDQGVRLSGGQRQRIALARALLKDPPILVLDEATAMFDPEAERSFIADCHDALARRTVILITHRPASLALADRVLRLEGGVLHEVPRGGAAQP
ncbi:ABC transporter ATP-binding protein [Hydrogenophaga sp. RWCD_12]|uniref:ABC transporter ATP-binding protein n=1 Tax=Hydrogenophaga sp. RWCD_12 TaxID=3391190 RepID=UPI0039852C85